MRVAFYAPLKPPDHPVPSGDRQFARLLMAALARAGAEVRLASRLRSRDGGGDHRRQQRLQILGERLAQRLLRRYRSHPGERPHAWFTYHLYHKAPDWIGPLVSAALGIPYLVAEASHATRQAGGAWDLGHRATGAALARATVVLALNPEDVPGIAPLVREPGRVVRLPPFLDVAQRPEAGPGPRAALACLLGLPRHEPWLVAVGMMRPGPKLAAYRLLSRVLAGLGGRAWRLLVVGGGSARAEVEAALGVLPPDRIRFLGEQSPEGVSRILAAADLCVWAAAREPVGLALLEAQAAGIPVVACRTPGVATVVEDGATGILAGCSGPADLRRALVALLDDPARRERLGRAARRRVLRDHGLDAAAARLREVLGAAATVARGCAR